MSSGKKEASARTEAQFNDEDGEVSTSSCLYSSIDDDGCQEDAAADESEQSTRKSYRGALDTCTSEGGLSRGSVKIDWLSFTMPCEDKADMWQALMWTAETFGDLVDRSSGFSGYERAATILGTGSVGWSEARPTQGVFISLGSQALGVLAQVDEAAGVDPRGFLRYVLDSGANIRRVDLAMDDRDGRLRLDTIEEKVVADEMTSTWRKFDKRKPLRGGGGVTIYCGVRTSDSYMRMYDKRLERMEKGEPDPGEWRRCELELKRKRAHIAVEALVKRGLAVLPAIIYSKVDFKQPTGDSNKARWPTCEWWSRFLGYVERLMLQLPSEARTLEDKERWARKSAAPTIATLFEWHDGSMSWLLDFLDHGRRRRSVQDRALLEAAQAARAVAG